MVTYSSRYIDALYGLTVSYVDSPVVGQRVGYVRDAFLNEDGSGMPLFDHRRDLLIEHAKLRRNHRILVAGCGLGFLIESFARAGFMNVWGCDNGEYVKEREQQIGPGVRERIDFRDVRYPTDAGRYSCVISEDLISGYDDDELPEVFEALEAYLTPKGAKSRVVHITTATTPNFDGLPWTGDTSLNWKMLEEWKALRPEHTWIHIARNLVL